MKLQSIKVKAYKLFISFPFLVGIKNIVKNTINSISNSDKKNIEILEVARKEINSKKCSLKYPPLLIMTTFNDHDIIESIILKNMEAGLEQIIIDNWSSDGTWTIIEELRKKYPKKITAFHYPFEGPTSNFMWRAMLDLKTNIALHHKGRWIIHQDSDEYTIPPIKGIQLGDFLSFVEQEGFNCVSLRMLDFVPLNDDFTIGNPISHFKNYRISDIPSYIIQNKIWLQGDDKVDLVSSGGHNVFFKGRKIFPLRLPRFHYSIRSIEHAKSKYSPKRAERVKEEQEVLGWHGHTDFKIKEKVIYKEDETIRYHFDDLYTKKIKLFKF